MEFEWDKGNIGKNKKHRVSDEEAEEIFSDLEKKRQLLVIYTIRDNRIRIISARDLNKKKEKHLYEKAFNTTKI
ncbi:BrnT family toxin [Candidatus Amesbacteria bacterium]|nr:BrnT family toxin [Candidatus Amesbacteria bacterium]